MRLMRNATESGQGKYSLIDNRTGARVESVPGSADEFFVLKLKDLHSEPALRAYANSVRAHDPEFAADLDALAARAGKNHPNCKQPD